jgi:hypothetical protein
MIDNKEIKEQRGNDTSPVRVKQMTSGYWRVTFTAIEGVIAGPQGLPDGLCPWRTVVYLFYGEWLIILRIPNYFQQTLLLFSKLSFHYNFC